MNKDSKIVRARASFVRQNPRKLRLVVDSVRGMEPLKAVNYLKLLPQRAAKVVLAVYQQAIGNGKNNLGISPADLRTKSVQVMGGPKVARKPDVHAHGARFDRGVRNKTLSHVFLELEEVKNGTKS